MFRIPGFARRSRDNRQANGETRAAAIAILCGECAAVGFDETARDRQAESKAAGLASVAAIKFLEHPLWRLRGARPGPRSLTEIVSRSPS